MQERGHSSLEYTTDHVHIMYSTHSTCSHHCYLPAPWLLMPTELAAQSQAQSAPPDRETLCAIYTRSTSDPVILIRNSVNISSASIMYFGHASILRATATMAIRP